MYNYILSYNEESKNKFLDIRLSIKTEFLNDRSKVVLQLPLWRPGRYQKANYYKNIQQLRIIDQNQNLLVFSKLTTNSIEVLLSDVVSELVVEYNYYSDEINSGSTFVDQETVYVNPVNCCFYVVGYEDKEVNLALKIPDDYILASALIQNSKNIYQIDTLRCFFDTPFIAAKKVQKDSFKVNQVEFNLWFTGEVKPDFVKLINDFKLFSQTQIDFMGNFPEKVFNFIFIILHKPSYHGVEHKDSTVITLGPSYAIMDKNQLYDELLGISSHELFHVWNIKHLRPKGMQPYDYSKPNYSRLGFVYEGFTTYLGDYFLLNSRVHDWEAFSKNFNKLLNNYLTNFGRLNLSLADSSFDTWVDGYERGIPEKKVSIYTKGALVAFLFDYYIRKHTNNSKSLVSLIKMLYEKFSKSTMGYTIEDVKEAFKSLTCIDINPFFSKYIEGMQSIEAVLKEAVNFFGCEIKQYPHDSTLAANYGVIINKKLLKVEIIHPDSDLKEVLVVGDKLLALNKVKLNTENYNNWISYFNNQDLIFTIERSERIYYFTVKNNKKNKYFKKYEILKLNNAKNSEKSNFNKFTNQDF